MALPYPGVIAEEFGSNHVGWLGDLLHGLAAYGERIADVAVKGILVVPQQGLVQSDSNAARRDEAAVIGQSDCLGESNVQGQWHVSFPRREWNDKKNAAALIAT